MESIVVTGVENARFAFQFIQRELLDPGVNKQDFYVLVDGKFVAYLVPKLSKLVRVNSVEREKDDCCKIHCSIPLVLDNFKLFYHYTDKLPLDYDKYLYKNVNRENIYVKFLENCFVKLSSLEFYNAIEISTDNNSVVPYLDYTCAYLRKKYPKFSFNYENRGDSIRLLMCRGL